MMSESKTNRPIDEKERQALLNSLIRERFGEWATNKQIPVEEKESE